MAINIGDAVLMFKGDMSGLNTALDAAQRNTQQSMGAILDSTQRAGMAFTAFGAGVVAPMGLAVKAASDFGKGMAEVSSLGVKDLAAIEEAVKSTATTYGVELKDGVNAAYQALSAGVPEANLPSFLEEAAKAATAGMTDLSTAIEFGSNMVNVWGGDVTTQFDQAFVAVKDGVLRFEDLNASIGRLAPTFNGAGLASKDMYASVAALTTQGIKAEEAVTGMKAVLTNIIAPSKEAADTAAALGIQFDIGAVKSQGLSGFLNGLKQATGGNIEIMSQLFGSVEALNSVMALTSDGGGAKFDQILKDMDASAGATAQAFDLIVQNDPSLAFRQLKAEISVLAVEMGQTLMPAIKGIVDWLKPLVGGVLEFSQEHPGLMKFIVGFGAAAGTVSLVLGGMLLAIKPIVTTVTTLAAITGPLVAGFKGTGAAATAMASDIKSSERAAFDFTEEIKDAENKIKQLAEETKTSKRELREYESSLKAAERALATSNKEHEQAKLAIEKTGRALADANNDLEKAREKFEKVRVQAQEFAQGLDKTGISAKEMAQKFRDAKQAIAEKEQKIESLTVKLRECGQRLDETKLASQGAATGLDGARASATQAAEKFNRLEAETKSASVALDRLRVDSELLSHATFGVSRGIHGVGGAATATSGKIAHLGGRLGDASGLASDMLHLVGVSNPVVDKITEVGLVASQAGFLVAGFGTAATGAAGVAGGAVGVAGLTAALGAAAAAVGTIGVILAGFAAWYAFGKAVLAVKDSFDQLHESQAALSAKESEYDAQLRERGAVLNEAAMAEMDYAERMAYRADAEKASMDALARAHLEHYLGRVETEQEYAQARNLMLNENISAEEAAIIVSKNLGADKLRALMQYDKDETESFLQALGLRQDGALQGDAAISQSALDNATTRQQSWINAEHNIVNESAAAQAKYVENTQKTVEESKGYWDSFWSWLLGLFGTMPEVPKPPMPPEAHAKGGQVGGQGEMATILGGEEGPELGTAPSGEQFMIGAMGPGLFNVPVGTYINTAAETAALFGGSFARGGVVLSNEQRKDLRNLRDKLGVGLKRAMAGGMISFDEYTEAWFDLNSPRDSLGMAPISGVTEKNGKVIGATGESWRRGGEMSVGLSPEQHGLYIRSLGGELNLRNVPGFATGGFVGRPTGGGVGGGGGRISINGPLVNIANATIREDADIDRISTMLAQKISVTMGNWD